MNAEASRREHPKRATVLDVASRAGVSRQTVTRAMNDMTGISAATKQRVLAVAKELKYRPSRFGRGLVLGHQLTLGFVLDDLTNPYYPELASSVVSTASDLGWNVVVADSAHTPNGIAASLKALADQVDAVVGYIRVPPDDFDEIFGDLPLVVLESSPGPGHRGVIELDFGPGLREAVAYLSAHGRERIVMLDGGVPGQPSDRGGKYVDAMNDLGREPLIHHATESLDGGIEATQRLVSMVPDVDAIIAFNDILAFGVMKSLHRMGINVPDQCAVVGIDGLSIGRFSTPELSSLALDLAELGRLGVELASQIHSGALPASGTAVQRTVSHTLLLRESA